MTRDADLDAGRRKLKEFKKAKDAAKHRDAAPSDAAEKEKPEKMKNTPRFMCGVMVTAHAKRPTRLLHTAHA